MKSRITILLSLVTTLAFAVSAGAQRGFGGGFGGGRGGFGGRSGGFGGGGGGFARGGGGFGGGGGFYFGPRMYVSSGSAMLWIFLILILFVVGLIAYNSLTNWLSTRFGMMTLTLNLRNGDNYSYNLDKLLASSDFANLHNRTRAVRKFAEMINYEDVVDARCEVYSAFANQDKIGADAEDMARKHMARVGIHAESVNVANPEGVSVKVDAGSSGGRDEGSSCVISLVTTIRGDLLKNFKSGGSELLSQVLVGLDQLPDGGMDALYIYYAPNRSESLDPVSANGLFLDLIALRPDNRSGAGMHA